MKTRAKKQDDDDESPANGSGKGKGKEKAKAKSPQKGIVETEKMTLAIGSSAPPNGTFKQEKYKGWSLASNGFTGIVPPQPEAKCGAFKFFNSENHRYDK